MKMNYIHLCDFANVDSAGKLNIIGVFDRIFLQTMPSKYPRFTVVVSLDLTSDIEDKNILAIKIYDEKNEELKITPSITINFEKPKKIEGKQNPQMNLILEIANIDFTTYGNYKLKILINNKEVGAKSFIIDKPTK